MEFKLTDKYIREQFIGKTFTDKLNLEIGDYFIERKFSKLGFSPRPGVIAVCNVLEDNEIMQLGGSEPYDQINDNLGKWLTALCSPMVSTEDSPSHYIGTVTDPPVPISGVGNGNPCAYNEYNSHWASPSAAGNSSTQLGDGTSAPKINDYVLESPLSDSPEGDRNGIDGTATYVGTGLINFVNLVGPCTGEGFVKEMGWFMRMRYCVGGGSPNNNPDTFLFSHDLISPNLSYSVGQFILGEYFITI
jgi:hypothetical protein